MSSFDPLGPVLVTLAHYCGHLGWAILVLSFGTRLALLPLTLRLARRARKNQAILRTLQPEIDALKKRFVKKPELLLPEMQKLYRKHGCSPFDGQAIGGALLQVPLFAMLYRAISRGLGSGGGFLWIRDLALPDLGLTIILAALAFGSGVIMPDITESMRMFMIVVQVAVTVLLVAKLASGVGLYWAASSVVGLGQALWLRYVPADTKA
jgi:YidC/Oxa1 family membrane protein insertase